jgi:hypothetical protein
MEAERKVVQLNDEMQGLVRSLKTKDQSIQESVVKIELMERRMETVKKQADTIDDLAGELSKARKQERAYEEAMEQLQADLDALEQDNAKLKAMTAGPERQGAFQFNYRRGCAKSSYATGSVQPLETENVPIEGSLETSHLLEQVSQQPALTLSVRVLILEIRLMLFVALSVTCGQKTHTSKDRTCSKKFKYYPRFQIPSYESLHRHWIHLVSRTQMIQIQNRPHHRHCAPSRQKRSFCTAMSSSFRLRRVSWICLR